MDAFDAARKAAAAKGFSGTKVMDSRGPAWRRPGTIALVVLLLLIGAGVYWYVTRPAPPPAWKKYATTKEEAVKQHLEWISTGQDDDYLKAYAMLDPAVYDKSSDDEKGEYRQLYHTIYKYLTGEFGDHWVQNIKLTPDPQQPDRVEAKVDLETLHFRVAQMTPKQELDKGEQEHWAVDGIEEFSIAEAKGFQSTAAQMGVIRGVAGEGAVRNLETIIGASAKNNHETAMQKKVRMLPILRDPRETVGRTILQIYPLRDDPVVHARLEEIKDDTRYDLPTRDLVARTLKNDISEEELVGAGVQN